VLVAAFWFALAGLAKETAILAPLALIAWEILGFFAGKNFVNEKPRIGDGLEKTSFKSMLPVTALLISILPLALWYGYHYARKGYVFGNPEFFRYNVSATLSPTRFVLALGLRLWQICGYLHLWVLALAAFLAIWLLPPVREFGLERPRISLPQQMKLYVVITAYVVTMAMIGGAVLARYMLPAVPLVIILCISTLWRRTRYWAAVVALVALGFVTAWFWNPPYGFALEDNLAYRDYVRLHEDGERFLEARYPMAKVLTAWPASDEITRPWLGYITRPMRVTRIEDFSVDQVFSAAQSSSDYDVALIFSTKYEPGRVFWDRWVGFARMKAAWKSRYFGYHRDLPPASAASILGGRIVYLERRHGQWIAVIERQRIEQAERRAPDLQF